MGKGLTTDDARLSRETVFQEIRPGTGLGTGDFGKEKLGGATVERLIFSQKVDNTPPLDMMYDIYIYRCVYICIYQLYVKDYVRGGGM